MCLLLENVSYIFFEGLFISGPTVAQLEVFFSYEYLSLAMTICES